MKLLETLTKSIISELSTSIKQKMVDKFQKETDDSPEVIMDLLNKFEDVQNILDKDKRDINRYKYADLKNAVALGSEMKSSKKEGFSARGIFDYLKKKNHNIPDAQAKLYIKKYLEIRSELPKEINDVYKYRNYEELVKIIDSKYAELLIPKMVKKFMDEDSFLNKNTIEAYIERYIEDFNRIPVTTKSIIQISFNELEHLLDGMETNKKQFTDKSTMNSVPVIYDENGLIIWAPENKEQCISLAQGRRWCTSQPGSGNLYYNYRYGSNYLTLYYVTDKDLPFDDTNYASVILVDKNGGMRLADKSNGGNYGGSTVLPWSTIISKIPKLKGLEHLLKWRPLSDKELEVANKYKSLSADRVSENPLQYFNNDQETLDIWMELTSPRLSDKQYINLPVSSKKKWIGLQMELTANMIEGSEPEVINYIKKKSTEKIINKTLSELTVGDITLLNKVELLPLKVELKPKFVSELNLGGNVQKSYTIDYPENALGKFICLYGLENLLQVLPDDLQGFAFKNTSKDSNVNLKVPKLLGKFTSLSILELENCISELPVEVCNLENLKMLALLNNKNLTHIPECIGELPNIAYINLRGSDNVKLSDDFKSNFTEADKLVFLKMKLKK